MLVFSIFILRLFILFVGATGRVPAGGPAARDTWHRETRARFLCRTSRTSCGKARGSPPVSGLPFVTAGVLAEAARDAETIGATLAI